MKKILFTFFLCAPFLLIAQQSTIQGVVSIMNSKINTGKVSYVPFAEVKEDYGRSQPTTTDENGRFNMMLVKVREKESIQFNIFKKGLEVINIDQLSAVAGQKETIKIFMANPKTIADNRKKYYEVGITTAERKLSQKIKGLKNNIAKLKEGDNENLQKIAELQQEIVTLQEKFLKIDNNAKILANKYSRINFDEADEMLQQAFLFFQNGEFEKALQSINEQKIDEQSEDGVRRRDQINKARKMLDSLEQKNEAFIQRLIPGLLFKADLYELFQQTDSVSYCFDLLLKMDSSKVDILSAYASFNARQNNFKKAQQLYAKCIDLSDTIGQAKFLHKVGVQMNNQRKFIAAQKKFEKAIDLLTFHSITAQKKLLLTEIHLTLANVLQFREILFDSYEQYKLAKKYAEELFALDPKKHQGTLASTYDEIGRFFLHHNWYERAPDSDLITADKYFYSEKAIETYQFLESENQTKYQEIILSIESVLFIYKMKEYGEDSPGPGWEKILLAQLDLYNTDQLTEDKINVLTNLANYYYLERDTKKAESHFKKALDNTKNLAQENPDRYDPLYAQSIRNLGNFYSKIGDPYSNCQDLYKQAILIADQYNHIPKMEDLSESLLKIVDIATVYPSYKKWESKTDDLETALFYATRPLPQEMKLKDYKDIAQIQNKILEVWLSAYRKNPDNPHYKYEIARYSSDLAKNQLLLKNFQEAEVLSRRSMIFDNRDSYAPVYLAVALLYLDRFEECKSIIEDYQNQPNTFNTANYGGLNFSWKRVLINMLSTMIRMNIKHKDFQNLEEYFDKTIWVHIMNGW